MFLFISIDIKYFTEEKKEEDEEEGPNYKTGPRRRDSWVDAG